MTREVVAQFPRPIREIEHILIPLRDGTQLGRSDLAAELTRSAKPVPAILEYLPYRKRTGTYERDALTHPYFAGHGYAAVRVDIRGSWRVGRAAVRRIRRSRSRTTRWR